MLPRFLRLHLIWRPVAPLSTSMGASTMRRPPILFVMQTIDVLTGAIMLAASKRAVGSFTRICPMRGAVTAVEERGQ